MRQSLALLWTILLGLFLAARVCAAPVSATFEPLFEGDSSGPVLVTVSNDGPATEGRAEVIQSGARIFFPFELPSGVTKQLVLPGSSVGYGEIYRVTVGRQTFERPAAFGFNDGTTSVVVIGDDPALYRRLNGAAPIQEAGLLFATASVEQAPNRASHYNRYRMVWLAGGADRLAEDQVQALQDYLLMGGTVALLGGPQPGALRDPRWQRLTGKFAGLRNSNQRLLTALAPRTFSHLEPVAPLPGTAIFGGMGSYVSVGAGRLVILTFAPLDPAFVQAGTASRIAQRVVSFGPPLNAPSLFDVVTLGRSLPGEPVITQADFETEGGITFTPPEANQLFQPVWLFALLLVPLALFGPRWIKRPQWSWVALPAVSVIISSYVLLNQGPLSQLGFRRDVTAAVRLQEGLPDGVASGWAVVFMPRAGVIDLQLPPLEYARLSGGGDLVQDNWMDIGAMNLSPLRTRNLEFRRVDFQSRVPGAGSWIQVTRQDGWKRLRVTNQSPYAFKEIWLPGQGRQPLARGASVVLNASLLAPKDRVILFRPEGVPIGPQIAEGREDVIAMLRLRPQP